MKECLTYGNSTWNKLVEWFTIASQTPKGAQLISSYLNTELNRLLVSPNIDEFSSNGLCSKMAKLILILSDSAGQEDLVKKSIESVVDKLFNCNKYIYMSQEVVESCLGVFNSMLSYTNGKQFIWSFLPLKR